jgi:GNAT acetyltransferase-like protein
VIASLIEDGGATAADPGHFFRSPGFLAAEGATHSLRVDTDPPLLAPLIVREIEGGGTDAISPYGYPGATAGPQPPPDPGAIDWSRTGLVSVFVRDRIGGDPCFAGATVRSKVWLADPRAESGVRKRMREQIRANERRGWSVGVEPGPDAEGADRAVFAGAYEQTMRRTDAAQRYLFGDEYFEQVLSEPSAWLLLAGRRGEPPSAGAIAVTSDGHLHYFLGGTSDAALEDSPMKNLFAAMIALAGELGLVLNLGGGVTPGDSLDSFKRRFANEEAEFRTHEIVADAGAYERLSAGREPAAGFFPAYRA